MVSLYVFCVCMNECMDECMDECMYACVCVCVYVCVKEKRNGERGVGLGSRGRRKVYYEIAEH